MIARKRSRFCFEELALLEEIHANPRSDAPRWIYADWLEDRGNTLSELIRWQLEEPIVLTWEPRRKENALYANAAPPTWTEAINGDFQPTPLSSYRRVYSDRLPWAEPLVVRWMEEWLRPFPREFGFPKDQKRFYRGLPILHLLSAHIYDVERLDLLAAKTHLHQRISFLQLHLGMSDYPIEAILAHPAMRFVCGLIICVSDAGRQKSFDFLSRLANSPLPDKISWLCVGWRGNLIGPVLTDVDLQDAVQQRACELLSGRMHLNAWQVY